MEESTIASSNGNAMENGGEMLKAGVTQSDAKGKDREPRVAMEVTHLLRPARAAELGEGLPRKRICASDHLAMGCEVVW